MKTAIFIRSYDKDYQWLAYALRSIQRFATGFCEVIVAVPEGQQRLLSHLTAETVIAVNDGQPGYLKQQTDKLHADLHTQADYILHIDSDNIFTRPVTPLTFMDGDKVRWFVSPWSSLSGGDEKKAWFHVLAKCIRECPPYEFMRKNTIMVPRWAYGEFREFIKQTHGIPLDAYVMNQPNHEFSEYNCLGFYLWQYHRDKFSWHDCSVSLPEPWEKQRWSWGGLTPEIRAELETALT